MAKRILYLANLNPDKLGSIEEHALFLARELRLRGYECFIGFISEPIPIILNLFRDVGAKVLTVNFGDIGIIRNFSISTLQEALSLRKLVTKHCIDIVHINFMGLTSPILLGIYFSSVKIIFTEHSSGLPLRRGLLKKLISYVIHVPLRMRLSRYIGVSHYVVNRLKLTHHVAESETLTIYNGVNFKRFTTTAQDSARSTLGLPRDIKIISSVAMLIPEKGIQHLIDAIALLVTRFGHYDLLVLIIGEGGYRETLEQKAVQLGVSPYITFLGRRSDVHDIIAASDVVAVPCTWEESFGLIIAEAMAGGKPVVASRTGGIPELIDDGVTGFLVSPGNSKQLAQFLHRLLSNPDERMRMGKAGYKKAHQMFDLVKQVDKLVDLYSEIFT